MTEGPVVLVTLFIAAKKRRVQFSIICNFEFEARF